MKNQQNTPPKVLQEAFDAANFRALGHQVIDLLANHLEQSQQHPDYLVYPYQNPEDALAYWEKDFQSDSTPIEVFDAVLKRSINVHHPRYIGHQVAAPAFLGGLAGLVSDLLSNGNGVYEMGMASNPMEKIVTDFVAQAIGYDSAANGLLTSGGTLANLTALLAARGAKAPSPVWEKGHRERLAIMVSEEAHYCIDRAARIMGLGAEGIIKVPVDEHYKIRTDLLENHLAKAKKQGLHVFALVGCASSTSTGSYDDLVALGRFCQQHQLWFHVDGAHGGGVVFSKKYQHLVNGIEFADSVVIDFHKMMAIPALNTALIFKNGAHSYHTFQQRAQYLWDSQQSEEWHNSGKRTFECTKLMMSLKVYTVIKAYGATLFEQNIEHLYDMGQQFAKLIKQRKHIELALEPEANIVNFRYTNTTIERLDKLNAQIRQQLLEDGKFYIVQTVFGGNKYLRTTIMNPFTTLHDLEALLDEIERIAEGLEVLEKA